MTILQRFSRFKPALILSGGMTLVAIGCSASNLNVKNLSRADGQAAAIPAVKPSNDIGDHQDLSESHQILPVQSESLSQIELNSKQDYSQPTKWPSKIINKCTSVDCYPLETPFGIYKLNDPRGNPVAIVDIKQAKSGDSGLTQLISELVEIQQLDMLRAGCTKPVDAFCGNSGSGVSSAFDADIG